VQKKALLQNPQGSEGIYLEDAFRHRAVVADIEKMLLLWGYLPAQTPVFDFFDIYRNLLDEESLDTVYRLFDRDGDLLMLRSDITLFLAKQMGMLLKQEDLPIRVCYSDAILRHQNSDDIARNEFYQVGAELIGKEGIEGDLEIISLLLEALQLIEVKGYRIHIGSRELFNSTFVGIPSTDKQILYNHIMNRDLNMFPKELARLRIGAKKTKFLHELYFFIGGVEELSSLQEKGKKILSEPEYKAINHLLELVRQLLTIHQTENLRIDLSEIGIQPYYSGIVFQTYIEGADSSIASGGRYDHLLGLFGHAAASVGFSLMLRKIESISGLPDRYSLPTNPLKIKGNTFSEAMAKARELHKKGKIALL
jgi:ATP phosphoribosyltransferase regulatory subunit